MTIRQGRCNKRRKVIGTSVRSCLISSVNSSHWRVYCHLAVFSLSTICSRCRCFCSSSSFCARSLLKLHFRQTFLFNSPQTNRSKIYSFTWLAWRPGSRLCNRFPIPLAARRTVGYPCGRWWRSNTEETREKKNVNRIFSLMARWNIQSLYNHSASGIY